MVIIFPPNISNGCKCSMFVQNVKLSVILWWTVYYIFNRPDVVDHIIQKPVFKWSYFHFSLSARHRQGEHGQYMVRQSKTAVRRRGTGTGGRTRVVGGARMQAELYEWLVPLSQRNYYPYENTEGNSKILGELLQKYFSEYVF